MAGATSPGDRLRMACSISVRLSARAAIRGLSIFPLKSATPISRPCGTLAQQACNRDRSVVPGWPADLHNSVNRYPGVLGQTPRERLLEERRPSACRIKARTNEVPFALAKRPASRDLGGAHTITHGQGERASVVDRQDKTAILATDHLARIVCRPLSGVVGQIIACRLKLSTAKRGSSATMANDPGWMSCLRPG